MRPVTHQTRHNKASDQAHEADDKQDQRFNEAGDTQDQRYRGQ